MLFKLSLETSVMNVLTRLKLTAIQIQISGPKAADTIQCRVCETTLLLIS